MSESESSAKEEEHKAGQEATGGGGSSSWSDIDENEASGGKDWISKLLANLAGQQLTSSTDITAGMLHSVMLELGFRNLESDDLTIVPDNWKTAAGYSSKYRFLSKPEAAVALTITSMGPILKVHGVNISTKESFSSSGIKPIPSQSSAGRESDLFERLSRQFKNEVGVPLLNSVKLELGYQITGLVGMPPEVLLKIYSNLDLCSVISLARVNVYLNSLYKDTTIWRKLFIRDFGQRSFDKKRVVVRNSPVEDDWYLHYKEEHQNRKQSNLPIDELMVRPYPPLFPIPDFSHHPDHPELPGTIPGFIGGEYDRFPGGGGPRPPFGPGMGMPRPRFDPPGPNFPPFGPRRGRGGRGGFGGPPGFGGGGFGGFF